MSQIRNVLQRFEGSGWIVLSDQLPTFGAQYPDLADHLLEHSDLSLSPFVISAGDRPNSDRNDILSDLEGLLGMEVEHLLLQEAQYARSAESGLFVLSGGRSADWVNALATSDLGKALRGAVGDGALLLAADAAAAAMGAWVLELGSDEPIRGLEWLPGAIILPWIHDPATSEPVRSLLSSHDRLYALGIEGGRVVAFGPEGEFQLWGGSTPTVVLGKGWG